MSESTQALLSYIAGAYFIAYIAAISVTLIAAHREKRRERNKIRIVK